MGASCTRFSASGNCCRRRPYRASADVDGENADIESITAAAAGGNDVWDRWKGARQQGEEEKEESSNSGDNDDDDDDYGASANNVTREDGWAKVNDDASLLDFISKLDRSMRSDPNFDARVKDRTIFVYPQVTRTQKNKLGIYRLMENYVQVIPVSDYNALRDYLFFHNRSHCIEARFEDFFDEDKERKEIILDEKRVSIKPVCIKDALGLPYSLSVKCTSRREFAQFLERIARGTGTSKQANKRKKKNKMFPTLPARMVTVYEKFLTFEFRVTPALLTLCATRVTEAIKE